MRPWDTRILGYKHGCLTSLQFSIKPSQPFDDYFGQKNGGQCILREAVALLHAELDSIEYGRQLYLQSGHVDIERAANAKLRLGIIREQINTLSQFLEGEDQTLGTLLQQLASPRTQS